MELFEKVDALVDRVGLTAVLVALRDKVTLMAAAPPGRWAAGERERLKDVEGLLAEAADELTAPGPDAAGRPDGAPEPPPAAGR